MAKSPPSRKRLFICTQGCLQLIFRFGIPDKCPNCESPVTERLYDGDDESPTNIRSMSPTEDEPELVTGGQIIRSLKELMSRKALNPLRIIDESNKAHLVQQSAIVMVLMDKGIVTQEEWDRYRIKAIHLVDQMWAEKKAEQERAVTRLRQQDPAGSAILGALIKRRESDADRGSDSTTGE